MGGELEKQGKSEKQPSENVMKMPMLWVLHMTQTTCAGEGGKELFKHVYKDNLFHTKLGCNIYPIKAPFNLFLSQKDFFD